MGVSRRTCLLKDNLSWNLSQWILGLETGHFREGLSLGLSMMLLVLVLNIKSELGSSEVTYIWSGSISFMRARILLMRIIYIYKIEYLYSYLILTLVHKR